MTLRKQIAILAKVIRCFGKVFGDDELEEMFGFFEDEGGDEGGEEEEDAEEDAEGEEEQVDMGQLPAEEESREPEPTLFPGAQAAQGSFDGPAVDHADVEEEETDFTHTTDAGLGETGELFEE